MTMPIRGPATFKNIIASPRIRAATKLVCSSLVLTIANAASAAELTGVEIARKGDAIEAAVALSGPAAHAIKLGSGGLVATITVSGLSSAPAARRLDVSASGLTSALIGPGGRAGEAMIMLIASAPLRLSDTPPEKSDGFIVSLLVNAAPAQPSAERIAERPIPSLETANFPAPPPLAAAPRIPQTHLPPAPAGMAADDPRLLGAARGEEAALVDVASYCMTAAPPQYDLARQWLEFGVNRGSALAAFDLGQMARRGLGHAIDEAAAMRWYRLSAERGFAAAQYNLALMLLEGRAAQPDPAAARRLLKEAAEQGYEPAKPVLAELSRTN